MMHTARTCVAKGIHQKVDLDHTLVSALTVELVSDARRTTPPRRTCTPPRPSSTPRLNKHKVPPAKSPPPPPTFPYPHIRPRDERQILHAKPDPPRLSRPATLLTLPTAAHAPGGEYMIHALHVQLDFGKCVFLCNLIAVFLVVLLSKRKFVWGPPKRPLRKVGE